MDPTVEDLFRQTMRRFAATVSVITCASEGRHYGVTATAVTSLCAEPASVLICLNAGASLTLPLLREGVFCLNVLKSCHVDVSRKFGGQAKGADRFRHGTWLIGESGCPYLEDAQGNLFCRTDGVMPYGTHRIIVGRVMSGRFASQVSPLIYQDGTYTAASGLAA